MASAAQPMDDTHVKLLAFDLLSLAQSPSSDAVSFSRNGLLISRAETLGTVVSRDHMPSKFLKFVLDDGTACVSCVLWLNQSTSPYLSRCCPFDARLVADMATDLAAQLKLGVVARVRGRVSSFRDSIQITVSDVVIEKDPNAELLHWLDCIRLARKCYDVVPHST